MRSCWELLESDMNHEPLAELEHKSLEVESACGSWGRFFLKFCLFFAVIGALYLAAVSIEGGGVAGCGPQSGCNKVLSSRWAYWLGLPVSVPAAVCYALLLVLSVLLDANLTRRTRSHLWTAVVFLVATTIGAAIWFVVLQLFVVKAWCKFCLATHVSSTVASLALLRKATRFRSAENPTGRSVSIRRWGFALTMALLSISTLILGQIMIKARLFAVSRFLNESRWNSNSVVLYGGAFRLRPDELPTIGAGAGTNFIVSLFDYTCSHCRALHPLLARVEQNYQGRLHIISLPVPLDAMCNSTIILTSPANRDACEYAKIALAVWRCSPNAFAKLDAWLFLSPTVPPLNEARARAEALVGKDALARALTGSWVNRQLETDVALYQANLKATGDGRLPQLIFAGIVTHGAINDQEELSKLISQYLHLTSDPEVKAPVRP